MQLVVRKACGPMALKLKAGRIKREEMKKPNTAELTLKDRKIEIIYTCARLINYVFRESKPVVSACSVISKLNDTPLLLEITA